MAPPAADVDLGIVSAPAPGSTKASGTRLSKPLQYSGSLDQYESFDVTAVIGREYPKLQLTEILSDDAKLRDLAITGRQTSFCVLEIPLSSLEADRELVNSVSTWCHFLPQPGSRYRKPKSSRPKARRTHGQARDVKGLLPQSTFYAFKATDGISCIDMP
jgi:hypothetical protein